MIAEQQLRAKHSSIWGGCALAIAFGGLAWSVLAAVVPARGWLSGLAVLAGSIAYAMMAANLFLAIRHPVLERLFGPLDRMYNVHRLIGTSIVGVLGLHLVLIPIASLVDRHESILANFSAALPLGVLGMLILVGSIVLSLNTKVPYHKWQKLHPLMGPAFLVLTAHMVSGANLWFSLKNPSGAFLGGFALLGLGSFIMRKVATVRLGIPYQVVETHQRERGLEIVMRPEGTRRMAPHRPGQFIFLTATAGGAQETHPFTLTSPGGEAQISVLIRPSGDWTAQAQTGISVGDRVFLDGPYGAFTPQFSTGAPRHQVWIAGGAGITPFLSVLRTAHREWPSGDSTSDLRGAAAATPDAHSGEQVELVLAARDASDVPCWDELSTLARTMPGLTLTPAFSEPGGRLDSDAIDRLATRQPDGTAWYLCGPPGLAEMVERTLKRRTPAIPIHREVFEWRAMGKPARKVRPSSSPQLRAITDRPAPATGPHGASATRVEGEQS